jgi:hypothetical protein
MQFRNIWLCTAATLAFLLAEAPAGRAAETGSTSISDIQRLLAERDCENLSALYARAFDFNEGDRLKDLFGTSGVLDMAIAHLDGGAAIADFANKRAQQMASGEFLAQHGGPKNAAEGRHVITDFAFQMIDADHARATAYLQLYIFPAGQMKVPSLTPSMVGLFEDRYIRTAQGWRFEERKLTGVRAGSL